MYDLVAMDNLCIYSCGMICLLQQTTTTTVIGRCEYNPIAHNNTSYSPVCCCVSLLGYHKECGEKFSCYV